jgi:DNA-binding MarR family transcriptional regulator
VSTAKSASVGTVYLLKRAELAVRSCAETALARHGLTPAQFMVLFTLEYSSGVSSADLARATGVRPQSIVDLIGPLERRNLIRRKEDPAHRRILRIRMTASGERLFARALPEVIRLERELLANVPPSELASLRKGLTRLLANAEAHDTHPRARKRPK